MHQLALLPTITHVICLTDRWYINALTMIVLKNCFWNCCWSAIAENQYLMSLMFLITRSIWRFRERLGLLGILLFIFWDHVKSSKSYLHDSFSCRQGRGLDSKRLFRVEITIEFFDPHVQKVLKIHCTKILRVHGIGAKIEITFLSRSCVRILDFHV